MGPAQLLWCCGCLLILVNALLWTVRRIAWSLLYTVGP